MSLKAALNNTAQAANWKAGQEPNTLKTFQFSMYGYYPLSLYQKNFFTKFFFLLTPLNSTSLSQTAFIFLFSI
jgi:hypothetical protein